MIGADFKFSFDDRVALERLKLSTRQIDALEYFVPFCAMYLEDSSPARKNDVIDKLSDALDGALAVRDFIGNQQLTPAHFEAVHSVAATVGYAELRQIDHAVSKLQAGLLQARQTRHDAAQTRNKHNLMPLALIHVALHTGSPTLDAPLHDVMNNLPTDGLEHSVFRPSQSTTGPFAKVADAIYRLITGHGDADKGTGVPERALEAFAKVVNAAPPIRQ